MNGSRKRGHHFYRMMFFLMIVNIIITSTFLVVRYNYRYAHQTDTLWATQSMVHAYIDKVIRTRMDRSIAEVVHLANAQDLIEGFATEALSDAPYDLLGGQKDFEMISFINPEGEEFMRATFAESLIIEDRESLRHKAVNRNLDKIGQLKPGQVMMLPFEADEREGHRPILNVAMAVMSGDRLLGFLVAHLNQNDLFDDLHAQPSEIHEQLMVVDASGAFYYDEMEVVLDDDAFARFGIEDPEFFDRLEMREQSFDNDGLVTISPIAGKVEQPQKWELVGETPKFYLISAIPYGTFLAMSQSIFNDLFALGMGLSIILFILSILIASKLDENFRNRELIRQYATYDALTGCYNRRIGIDFLAKMHRLSKRSAKPLTLVYLDINHLKAINDQYGHTRGDQVIRTVSETIYEEIRHSDLMIRMGGDEFLVALNDCQAEEGERIFERVVKRLDTLEEETASQHRITFSYGIVDTALCPDADLSQLIREVDKRMYRHKRKDQVDHLIDQLRE